MLQSDSSSNLLPFESTNIRKVWYDSEWWFSIFDILQILTDTTNPKRYWNDLKKRDNELDKEGGTKISYPLAMPTAGGKQRVLCANTEGVLRLVMSVPSAKAEPLKQWLAQVGREKIEETANPELTIERMEELYRAQGRSEEWIKNRLQSIKTRKQLTDEWQKRGVKEGQEYSILTATIAKGTFGLTLSEHAKLKSLDKQNLRDHMTPLELIFTALGEELTRMETVNTDAQGFNENHEAAMEGGRVAGVARKRVEEEKKMQVVSAANFLNTELGSGEETTKKRD